MIDLYYSSDFADGFALESGCLETQPKEGGKLHLRLNITTNPIANKYREGKLKSTPEGELKYLKSLWWKRVPYFV